MTPLQIGGYFRLAQKQRLLERHQFIEDLTIASRGDGKDIKITQKKIREEYGDWI